MSTVITGVALQHAEIARLIAALSIEITTGLRHSRGSQMLLAKQWCGSGRNTKKGVLEDLVVWYYRQGGIINHQWRSVERALGTDRVVRLRRKVGEK